MSITLRQFLSRLKIKPYSKREWGHAEKILGLHGMRMRLHGGLLWSVDMAKGVDTEEVERKYLFGDAPINFLPPETAKSIKKLIRRRRMSLHPDKVGGKGEKMAWFNNAVKTLLNPAPDRAVVCALSSYSSDAFMSSRWPRDLEGCLSTCALVLAKLDEIHKELANKTVGEVDISNNEILQALYIELFGYMLDVFGEQKWCLCVEGRAVLNFFHEVVECKLYLNDMYKLIKRMNDLVVKLSNVLKDTDPRTMLTSNHATRANLSSWVHKMGRLMETMDIRVDMKNPFFQESLVDIVMSSEFLIHPHEQVDVDMLVCSGGKLGVARKADVHWMEVEEEVPVLSGGRDLVKGLELTPVMVRGFTVECKFSGRDKKRKLFQFTRVEPSSKRKLDCTWETVRKYGKFYDGSKFKSIF